MNYGKLLKLCFKKLCSSIGDGKQLFCFSGRQMLSTKSNKKTKIDVKQETMSEESESLCPMMIIWNLLKVPTRAMKVIFICCFRDARGLLSRERDIFRRQTFEVWQQLKQLSPERFKLLTYNNANSIVLFRLPFEALSCKLAEQGWSLLKSVKLRNMASLLVKTYRNCSIVFFFY